MKRFHAAAPLALASVMKATVGREASISAARMRETIMTEGASAGIQWESLSAWTSLSKGNEKLLRDTDTLLESIEVVKTGILSYEARINPEAVYPNGKRVIDIAGVHELGAIVYVEMTARMAKFLAIRAKELGIPPSKAGDTPVGASMLIRIPARPFAEPTMAMYFSRMAIMKRSAASGVGQAGFTSGSRRPADGPVVTPPPTGLLSKLFGRFVKMRR